MSTSRKLLTVVLVVLLACNMLFINASATVEGIELVTIDVNLEVGKTSGGVFTPLTPGEALLADDIITVRCAPSTDYFTGSSKIIVMYTSAYLQIQGSGSTAYTVNTANTFYATSCTNYSGTTNQLPVNAWPAALRPTANGGDGTYSSNTALSWTTQQQGTYPSHMPGTWLFSFDLKVLQNITPGSGAKVWMDSRWIRSSTNSSGGMTFTKCLDDSKLATNGNTNYPFNIVNASPQRLLEPAVNITFDSAGGSPVATITQNFGTTITEPADPTWDGYTFQGWDPDIPEVMPAEDLACVAQWEALPTSTIAFDLNGGTSAAIDPITLFEGAEVTAPDDPTRDGYTFAGWLPEVPETMPVEDITCVAKWLKDQSTITFDSAGGTAVAPITQDEGTAVTLPTAPTREGYTFDSWLPECPTTMPVENTLCVAQWNLNSYTITWDANGGTGGTTTMVNHGDTPTAPGGITLTGHALTGWTPTIDVATADTTYTAQWSANAVNITFDANGGIGSTGPTAMAYGSALTAPPVTKEGFVLAGWTPALPTTVPETDTTYVAQWEKTVVTVTMVDDEFEVNIQGWTADNQYQIWSYRQVTSDIILGNEGDVQANQWILSQGYLPGSLGTPDDSNDGSINFMIPTFDSPTENYLIALRIADADGNFISEIRDAYTPAAVQEAIITKVLVDGAVTTGYELREIKGGAQALIKVIGNLSEMTYAAIVQETGEELLVSSTNEFLWDISSMQPGIYTVEITATNGGTEVTQTVTFELFTLAGNTTYGSIDEMALDPTVDGVNITPTYANGTFSFRVREPGRAPQFRSVEYTNAGTIAHPITAPGVYHVYGYTTRAGLIGTEGSYDDGLIRTLVIPRTGSGAVTMTFTSNPNQSTFAKNTPIVFTANAVGLGEPGTVQYSFWRYDATGYVLVKDWSTSSTFSWTPARIGEYQLEARAKGAGALSYEVKKNLEVNITSAGEAKANITDITLNTLELNTNAQPKKPIMLKATATGTNGDDLLYKFFVYDDDMKNQQLKDYSVDQHCVWTPREAGTYTIIVLVKNQVSFGKFDAIASFDVTVN